MSGGAANANEAILPLLLAYPKIDGTPLELDIDRLATDASYNEQFMTEFMLIVIHVFMQLFFVREQNILVLIV